MSSTWDDQLADVSDPATDDQVAIIDNSTRTIARTDISNILDLDTKNAGYWDTIDDIPSSTAIISTTQTVVSTITLSGSGIYQVEARIEISIDGLDSPGVNFRFNFSGGGLSGFSRWGSPATQPAVSLFNASIQPFPGLGAGSYHFIFTGTLLTTAGGNLELSFGQNTLEIGTSVQLFEGSTFSVRRTGNFP